MIIQQKNTFTKSERLCSKKQIDRLFESGSSASSYPIKAIYLSLEETSAFPAQVMFVVPKRNFKLSPDRNKLKRRMREAYRLQKHEFYSRLNIPGKNMKIAFIYTARKTELYDVVQTAISKLLDRLSQKP